MGHVGATAIRRAWFGLVLPALLLNYFGQGALVLADPKAVDNPFYELAPGWALIPMVMLAALATIIASQALISGVFSLTRQAMQLGLCPRMRIVPTSSAEAGRSTCSPPALIDHNSGRDIAVDGDGRAYYSGAGDELLRYDPAANAEERIGAFPHPGKLRASSEPAPDGRSS